jgi:hypothetical protein
MRYTRIEGTAVSVSVSSAVEAKAALKELRHKKRELKFLRSALVKRQKAARAARPKKAKSPKTGFQTFLDDMRWGLSAIIEQGAPEPRAPKPQTPAEIESELKRTDEILHNIQGCILQLEGKLLAQG